MKDKPNWLLIAVCLLIGCLVGLISGQHTLLNRMGWELNSEWTDYTKDGKSLYEMTGRWIWDTPEHKRNK